MSEDQLPLHLKLAEEFATARPDVIIERTQSVAEVAIGGDEEGALVLLFLPDELDIRHRVVDWPEPHSPILTTQRWKRIKYGRLDAVRLHQLVVEAGAAWLERMETCKYCGQ